MKAYNQLTPIGKKRRLRKLAELALEQYNLDIESLNYYTEQTNIFFRLRDTQGKKYTLKIFREETTTIKDNITEIFFLREIKKNSDIEVPNVVLTKDNEPLVVLDTEYFNTPKRIAIYEWLDGTLFARHESMKRFYNLGAAMAGLHMATENTIIPEDMDLRKWNQVFYFRSELVVYKDQKYQYMLDENFHKVMDFILPYLNENLPKLYEKDKAQLIHGDLNPWNILISKEQFKFIDFEDNIWGTPLHDIAIMLFYYRYTERMDYKEVCKHFFAGYCSVKELAEFSEYDLELLIIARMVNFLNYVLVIDYEEEDFCLTRIKRVEKFIERFAKTEYENYLKQ